MKSNYVVSVPKLKGRENYNEWAFAAENCLILEGTSAYIKSDSDSSPIVAAEDTKTKLS